MRVTPFAHGFVATLLFSCLIVFVVSADATEAAGWKAGTAVVNVTPTEPMWMAGYASRTKPSEGTALDLFCKAAALEDEHGARVVIVTCDLIGIPRDLRNSLEQLVAEKYKLAPERLLLNASHTHCGPEFRLSKRDALPSFGDKEKQAAAYGERLREQLLKLVGDALADLKPAQLTFVRARCGFAMNRRTPSGDGYKNNPWSEGPVDQEVPVLKIAGADGKLRAPYRHVEIGRGVNKFRNALAVIGILTGDDEISHLQARLGPVEITLNEVRVLFRHVLPPSGCARACRARRSAR